MYALLIIMALVFLAAAIVLATKTSRLGKELAERTSQLAKSEQQLSEAKINYDAKCKEVVEYRSKLDRTRDETKKSKKRAFELTQKDKDTVIVPEKVIPKDQKEQRDQSEEVLQESRAQTHKAIEETKKATEAATKALEEKNAALLQLEKMKSELATANQALQERHEENLKTERVESESVKKLESELTKLQEKLELARRKSRNDAQVYRITKSKFDLALEKIARLERILEGSSSTPAPVESTEPSLSAMELPVSVSEAAPTAVPADVPPESQN